MKEDALKTHSDAVLAADGALYDQGFAEGKASVVVPSEGGTFTQADMDRFADGKVKDAQTADQAALDAVKSQLDAASAKLQSDEDTIAKIKAIFTPDPVAAAPVDGGPAPKTIQGT